MKIFFAIINCHAQNARAIALFFLLITLPLAGCATGKPATVVDTAPTRGHALPQAEPEDTASPQPIPMVMLYQTDATPGMFEPEDGVYLGAWLREYTTLRDFEIATGRRHAVYVHEMQLGDPAPIHWLLECISNMATPLIIIHPPAPTEHEEEPPNLEEKIETLAHRLGLINLPMFIAFYPPGHGLGAPDFTLLFNQARAIFNWEAPLAAFVWVAPSLNVTPRNPFFPGHNSVDWVAVSLLAARAAEGLANDILADFEDFYMNFAPSAPIAILPLGISHFSRIDHVYHVHCAAAEIKRVYSSLGTAFPRVGLIIYGDNNILTPRSSNDFSLTLDPCITDAYRQAIDSGRFVTQLDRATHPTHNQRWSRSAYSGYYQGGNLYLPAAALESLGLTPPRQTHEINGGIYVNISTLTRPEITFCTSSKVIFIHGH
ncbi:MAG: hypothetical protein FWC78_08205 [Defluviitaleaceae bacterium]|nr:hypothetical protein [Defluviitaleaceae bacterium]